MKKVEFSKLIFIFVAIVTLAVVVFTFIMVWKTEDLSPLNYLIPAVFAEAATGTGFYYSKSKVENKIKLMKIYGVTPTEQSFNENSMPGGGDIPNG